MLDFFKPKMAAEVAAGGGQGGAFESLNAKRKSEEALSEIHVNRGGARGKQQKRTGALIEEIVMMSFMHEPGKIPPI